MNFKNKKWQITISVLIAGYLLIVDRVLKLLITQSEKPIYLVKDLISWEYYKNFGIAFSIPLPKFLLLTLTSFIILGLSFFLYHKKKKSFKFILGSALIIAGALSNLSDRVFFGFVIDYFRFWTSVVNLADFMIIVGGVILVRENFKKSS